MHALNYLHLYYFWVASLERGFLKASKRLGMSQSTISTQVQNLEKQLNARLIRRGPRSFELTEQGLLTFEYCQGVFSEGQNLVRQLKSAPLRTAQIKVGIESDISIELQNKFLQSLMQTKGFTFKVELGKCDELLRKLAGRKLDVVLGNTCPSPTAIRPLKIMPIMKSTAVLVGKKKWRRKNKGASE